MALPKLTRKNLLPRLRWHNRAVPYIHTLAAQLGVSELYLVWHLAYKYDPARPEWFTAAELARDLGLEERSVMPIAHRVQNKLGIIAIERLRKVKPESGADWRIKACRLVLPDDIPLLHTPSPVWTYDAAERSYHEAMMQGIPSWNVAPGAKLLALVILYQTVGHKLDLGSGALAILMGTRSVSGVDRVWSEPLRKRRYLTWQDNGDARSRTWLLSPGPDGFPSEMPVTGKRPSIKKRMTDENKKNRMTDDILKFLADGPKPTFELARLTGWTRLQTYSACRRLLEDEKVTATSNGCDKRGQIPTVWTSLEYAEKLATGTQKTPSNTQPAPAQSTQPVRALKEASPTVPRKRKLGRPLQHNNPHKKSICEAIQATRDNVQEYFEVLIRRGEKPPRDWQGSPTSYGTLNQAQRKLAVNERYNHIRGCGACRKKS